MGQTLCRQGLCVIEMDLEGHGYSGGERAYVEDYHHWVDDYRMVRFYYGDQGNWLYSIFAVSEVGLVTIPGWFLQPAEISDHTHIPHRVDS